MKKENEWKEKKNEMTKEWIWNGGMKNDEMKIFWMNENDWNEIRKMRKRNECRNEYTGRNSV